MKLLVASLVTVTTLASMSAVAQSPIDPDLAKVIGAIKAVDNHTHVNSIAADDPDSDALPLDSIPPFGLPARFRPENMESVSAYKAIYGYAQDDLSEAHMVDLRATMQRIRKEQGDRFPAWALDKLGIEVMVANRIAMGPGLSPPRFLWASYGDALLFPLSTKAEGAQSVDAAALYPLVERLLRRYLSDLRMTAEPATLDAYLTTVLTPTLERQRKAGCIAVKFEAGYLRRLDFDEPDEAVASGVYAKYAKGGEPTHVEYKSLEDFLFRRIAREAGRLGMAVHIHSFEGAGGSYRIAGSDPLLLEPALNDPTLRGTSFVIVHGGGIFASHTGALLSKPNVFADFSLLDQIYSAPMLAGILRGWLTLYPEKVLFGTDAFGSGPEAGWEISAWLASSTARKGLAIALTGMLRDGEISRGRAEEIARLVLRKNAAALYKLPLR
ncbi:MAG: amidohydrolase family protein [Thermoanaerobaculia bacterium]